MSDTIELDLTTLEAAAQLAAVRFQDKWESVAAEDGGKVHQCVVVDDAGMLRCPDNSPRSSILADYVAAAHPSIVLELMRRLRIAEAVGQATMLRINAGAGDTLVIGIEPEFMPNFKNALAGSLQPGMRAVIMPKGMDVQGLDEDAMRAAGWVRAERGDA